MRISDWSSDVCSSDLLDGGEGFAASSAGNDVIDGGDGENLLAGDAMASNAQGGNATANSTADLTASVSGESNRSEEHTSELQSLMRISYAVFCLKNKRIIKLQHISSDTHIS